MTNSRLVVSIIRRHFQYHSELTSRKYSREDFFDALISKQDRRMIKSWRITQFRLEIKCDNVLPCTFDNEFIRSNIEINNVIA